MREYDVPAGLVMSDTQRKMLGQVFAGNDLVLAQGAVRSGKTYITVLTFVLWMLLETPKDANFLVCSQRWSSLRRNVVGPLLEFLRRLGVKYEYHRGNQEITIGGRSIFLVSADNERSQDTIQGMTIFGCMIDEVVLIPKSFYYQALARLSFDKSKMFCTFNPESPYHWFKQEVIDRQQAFLLKFYLDDNPSLGDKTKRRYDTMFTGVFRKRMIENEWSIAEGAIWDEAPLGKAPDGVNAKWTDVAIDYGTASVSAMLMTKWIDGVAYVTKELYHDSEKSGQLTDGQLVDKIIDFIGDEKVDALWVDPSAASLKLEMFNRKMRLHRNAINDVVNGIRTVGSFIARKELVIDPDNCPNLLKEMGGYVWDKRKQELGIDAPVKVKDHACDALRYNIHSRAPRAELTVHAKPRGF